MCCCCTIKRKKTKLKTPADSILDTFLEDVDSFCSKIFKLILHIQHNFCFFFYSCPNFCFLSSFASQGRSADWASGLPPKSVWNHLFFSQSDPKSICCTADSSYITCVRLVRGNVGAQINRKLWHSYSDRKSCLVIGLVPLCCLGKCDYVV